MTSKYLKAMALSAVGFPIAAMADSISPSTYSATVAVGGTTTVHKTVTVTPDVTTAKADVFFLFDTTGSMGSQISAAISAANTIATNLSGFGDVQFGVGEYKDGNGITSFDAFQYRLDSNIGGNLATGLGLLSAGGGGDTPESGLFATQQVANTTTWRAGSKRVIIEFGDAPSHENYAGNPTRATVISALQANNIVFDAIDYGGLNADPLSDFESPAGSSGGAGQASALAAATGGIVQVGSVGSIVTQIQNALNAAFSTYSSVSLDLSAVPAGLLASSNPPIITGSFDRSITRTFDFDLTFTGVTPGTYDFNVYGLVNGGRVATEADHIVVGGGGAVPEPSTYGLFAAAALVGLALRRRFVRKA